MAGHGGGSPPNKQKQLTLAPVAKVNGSVTIPGSKSLSNRILLAAALANGETLVRNVLRSDDSARMLDALRKLGAKIEERSETEFLVRGLGQPFSLPTGTAAPCDLFLGNAGTAMRPLTAVLCTGRGSFLLHGDERMHERPISHLVDALRRLGASITYRGTEGYPPLLIEAAGMEGGKTVVDGSISSQFLTALLMALPLAKQDSSVQVQGELVSRPYIDLTIAVLKQFGLLISEPQAQEFSVPGGKTYQSPGSIMVEGDASSASYFLAAAAIKGGTVRVEGVGANSVQGDAQFAKFLEKMGAMVTYHADSIEVSRGTLHGIDADFNEIPDAAMTIAVAALFAEGRTCIRNVYNWRVKETDRLAAMATELRKVGATVEEGRDYLTIDPPAQLRHAEIDTYNDHRIAMCFSLCCLGNAPITINDPDCTAKTFPNYFTLLKSICQ